MKKAKLQLPLCATCNGRWKSARIAAGVSGLLLLTPLLVVAIDAKDAGWLTVVLFAAAFVGLIVVMTVYVRPRLVQAKKIDDLTIPLGGVDPNAALYIARAAGAA